MKQIVPTTIVVILIALLMLSCSKSVSPTSQSAGRIEDKIGVLSGVYKAGPGNTIEFRAGGKAYVTVNSANELALSYTVDGERIIFSGPNANFVGRITPQGIQCEGHLYLKP